LYFKGLEALWSAPILMLTITIQHSFIEPHTTTKEIPSETARVNLDLGDNRWLDLIRLASNKLF